jgi:hypothetical protein
VTTADQKTKNQLSILKAWATAMKLEIVTGGSF